jgi:hypothetical protein
MTLKLKVNERRYARWAKLHYEHAQQGDERGLERNGHLPLDFVK